MPLDQIPESAAQMENMDRVYAEQLFIRVMKQWVIHPLQ
jgi:hypothetical protein